MCKRIVSVALALSFCVFVAQSASSAARPTGMIPDSKSQFKTSVLPLEKIARRPMAALPGKVKNITYLPVVRSQLLGNCGAYAPTYYVKTWQEAKEHGWVRPDPDVNPERVMSPGFTFPLTNNGENAGANIGHVMSVICRYGCADWKTLPETLNYTDYPSEAAWRNAIKYRGSQVYSIDLSTTAGLVLLKEQLVAGNIASIGVLLHHDTYDNYPNSGVGVDPASGVIYDHGSVIWDNHALTVIGYDDNKAYTANGIAKKGAFLVVNSWGPNWGVYDSDAKSGGFVWFSYDYMMTKRGGLSGGAYLMADRIGYKPTEFAVLDMYIAQRRYLEMTIYPGSPADRLVPSIEAFPNGGGLGSFTGRIVLDITEFAGGNPLCYTVEGIDNSAYINPGDAGVKKGEITSLTIEKANGQRIKAAVSASDPVEIIAKPDYFSSGYVSIVHAGPLQPMPFGLDDLTTQALRAAIGDWNRDGAPDLALSGGFLLSSRMVRAYRNIVVSSTTLQNLNSPNPSPGFVTSKITWGDYDNDGFPDLAVGGQIYTKNGDSWDDVCAIKIYRNMQTGQFADSGIALPAVATSGLAWGDVNNDGRIDLAFTGTNNSGQRVTKIYLNGGSGKFTDSGLAFPAPANVTLSIADMNNDGWLDLAIGNLILKNNGTAGTFTQVATLDEGYNSAHSWGDFNGDGLLDLAYCYINDDIGNQRIFTKLYRNNGNFSFSQMNAGLKGVYDASLAWADFDNDGRLDLALAGYPEDTWTSKTTRVYRQVTNGKFQDTGAYLAPTAFGTVAWADMDNDGDADLMVTGHSLDDPSGQQFLGATQYYASQVSRADSINRRNTPPAAPTTLLSQWDSAQHCTKLLWNLPTDAQTTRSALSYRVRVGTYPGGSDILSPHGDININGPHPHAMLSATQPGRLLTGLKTGLYYWAVQTIDNGLAYSPWSEEKTFTLGSAGLITGDVNRDGKLDVADVVAATLMAQGKTAAKPQYADLDGNGKVEALDAWTIARKLVGQDGAAAFMPLISATVGASGGTVGSDSQGIKLIVPSNSFSKSVPVALEVMGGVSGPEFAPLTWRVKGLPIDFKAPLKVRLRDLRSNTAGTPYVMIQIPGFSNTMAGTANGYIKRQATRTSDGWLEVTLDEPGALNSWEKTSTSGAPSLAGDAVDPLAGYDYTLVIYLLDETQWRYDGGHFRITAPVGYKDYLPMVATALEDAYAYYTTTLGFDLSRRNWTKYPMEVCVMDLGKGSSGEPVNAYTVSSMSYNGISLELNKLILNDTNAVRTSMGHEFFHVVQALYDSRNRVSRATTSPDLWLDEATATYLETHFATIPNYTSDVMSAYKFMMFDGYEQAERFWGSTAQDFGYGAATLIANVVLRNGNNPAIIKTIYDKKKAGMKGLHALEQSATGYPLKTWFTSLFENMLSGKIYPTIISPGVLKDQVAGKKRTLTLKTERQRGGHLPVTSMSDLSAAMTFLMFDDPLLNVQAGDKLGFQLKTDEPTAHNLAVMRMVRAGGANTFSRLGDASYDSRREALRLVLPNAADYIKKNTWLIPIVTNTNDDLPYDTKIDSTLYYGVFRDYLNQAITEHTHTHGHIWFGGEEIPFPTIKQSGKFSANDVTLLYERYKTITDPAFIPNVQIYMWGEPNDPVPFEFSAALTSTTYSGMSTDGRNLYAITVTSPLQYKMKKYKGTIYGPFDLRMELIEEGAWKSSPNTTLTLDDGVDMNMYSFDVKFSYNMKIYDTQNSNALIGDFNSTRDAYAFDVDMFRN